MALNESLIELIALNLIFFSSLDAPDFSSFYICLKVKQTPIPK